jgi:hypothetical protein
VVSVDVRHKNWQHLFRERRGVTFALRDHTGMAIVDPHNAEVALDFDHEERCGWRREIYITTSAEAPLSITSRAEPGEDA